MINHTASYGHRATRLEFSGGIAFANNKPDLIIVNGLGEQV